MRQLWIELARHARRHAAPWQSDELSTVHDRLASNVESWADAARGPRTLIHNDFNPRNITIRRHSDSEPSSSPVIRRPSSVPRLCAYDWELATIGLPQRDLAEFLAFVLSPHAEREEVMNWIDRYRRMLAAESGTRLGAADWLIGFRSALGELLVDRLAMYAMVDRFRPQRFLPRVVATWLALYRAVG
jgi:aminoglycoside phosphotransferase (APT) family kinase protein